VGPWSWSGATGLTEYNRIMKPLFFLILLSFCLTLSACIKVELEPIKPPNSEPVLDISRESVGLWDVTGKILYFRLYNNGMAEFDDLDENRAQKVNGRSIKTEDIMVRKLVQIDKKDFQDYINLISSSDFANLDEKYQSKFSCLDAFQHYDITVNLPGVKKHIFLPGYCGDLSRLYAGSSSTADLPEQLFELAQKIERDRLRANAKPPMVGERKSPT